MQKIDRVVGPVICSFLTFFDKIFSLFSSNRDNKNIVKKILLIKFWGMGSIILVMPAIKKIKEFYPHGEIHFLTLSRNKELLESYANIISKKHLLNIDTNFTQVIINILKLLFKLRKEEFEVIVDLEFFTSFSAIVTYLIHAKVRAGFFAWEAWRGFLHNVTVPFNRYWHVKKNFENLIFRTIGIENTEDLPLEPPQVCFSLLSQDNQMLSEEIKNLINKDYICVNVNTGELALERRWPKGNFISLCKTILQNFDILLVFIGSKKEKKYVESILHEIGNIEKTKNLAGIINFFELVILLKHSSLLITNDSGPLHLAASLGVPTISFFGPETPVLYGPIGENHIVFFKNIDCSPCINVHTGKIVKCVKTHPECMTKISVEEVFKTFVEHYGEKFKRVIC